MMSNYDFIHLVEPLLDDASLVLLVVGSEIYQNITVKINTNLRFKEKKDNMILTFLREAANKKSSSTSGRATKRGGG